MENALTFWDKNGNPILHIFADSNLDSGKLDDMFSGTCSRVLKKNGYEVDNTSEEEYGIEIGTEKENEIPAEDSNEIEILKTALMNACKERKSLGSDYTAEHLYQQYYKVAKDNETLADNCVLLEARHCDKDCNNCKASDFKGSKEWHPEDALIYAKNIIKEFVRELGAIGEAVGVDYVCDPITVVKKAQDFIGDDIIQSTDMSKEHQEVNVDLSIKLWLPIEWDEDEISGYVRGQLPEAYGERITNMINPVEIKDIKQEAEIYGIKEGIKTAIVYSSHGKIIINYNTGDVINIQGDEKGELKNIVKFDLVEYQKYHGQIDDSYDILNLGYWNNKGVYEEPCKNWREDREERLAEDAEHDKRVIKLDLLYRCGGNYKTPFEILVKVSEYPDVLKLKVDDQIEMGQYGTLTQGKFFNSEIHPHTYDGVYDHNLLEVEEITEEESKQ